MYKRGYTKQFKKSVKKILFSGQINRERLELCVSAVAEGKQIDLKYRDHALGGEYMGCRECHVKPDLLLIYKIEKEFDIIVLMDIGSHSELFG